MGLLLSRRVRPNERREVLAAFLMLFGLIFGHSVLETARDALFLTSIKPSRLPWVYIGIAAASLAITQLQSKIARTMNRRRALSVWTASAAVVTAGFWLGLDRTGPAGLYALYIWSGVLTTLVLVHFWTLLGSLFSVTQAKRLYGFIGTGSVLGAIVGSAGAGAMATVLPARHLLLVSSLGFAATAFVPLLFRHPTAEPSSDGPTKDGIIDSARFVWQQPYGRRVAAFVVLSTVALTLGDYVFKATVAESIAPQNLASFFGATYLSFNVLSLVCQVGLVTYVIRRFDLSTALSILPALILIGAVGFLVLPGLLAAMLIKTADGALKHSVHRTSTELMFVPFTARSRARVKAFIDVVGQRGGQTVASVAVLLFSASQLSLGWVAAVLAIVTILWIYGAIDIRAHYVDVFRSRVSKGLDVGQFADLDVASLETLIATLDSDHDAEVLAALDVLEREGRARLVPGLILYHPAQAVVIRALTIFVRYQRQRTLPAIDRLLEHPAESVRAAAVGARSSLQPDERLMRMRLSLEPSPQVRAAIMVNLIATGALTGSDADDFVEGVLRTGLPETQIALAEAIERSGAKDLAPVLVRLAEQPRPEVQQAATRAMAQAPFDVVHPALLRLLVFEHVRELATTILVEQGEAAYDSLAAALKNEDTDIRIRRRLPRVLVRFARAETPDLLLDRLLKTRDGRERYRLVLALETLLQMDPNTELSDLKLQTAINLNLSRAYRYLDRRITLSQGATEISERNTPGHRLLAKALRDKQSHALDRSLRLLGLMYPAESFSSIRRDIESEDVALRNNALELLENIVQGRARQQIVALVDDQPDTQRLLAGTDLHTPARLDYESLLRALLNSSSTAMQDIALFHIGELKLHSFAPLIRGLERDANDRADIERTLQIIDKGEHRTHAP